MPDDRVPTEFDLCGLLRRIRRRADLSQREMAARLGVSKSAVAAMEAGTRGVDARLLAAAADLAGLRLVLLDDAGRPVEGMAAGAVRDRAGRRFPAHLDTMLSEERAWRWEHQPGRPRPTYTFDRRSPWEDAADRTRDRPDDHLLPQPGDAPEERAAARRAGAARRRQEELQRRFEAGAFRHIDDGWTCACPPECDELDDRSGRPVHAEDCPCRCDVG
ncbi:helix-turn-helix transcriptional regulator [Blastococcus sp. BMG 814]|uniref:Helix-turn-helix transcriptional regulator n=1 Tax=Blastococcus carthaginiensis TaxID=3050034 RepID=A0ABT9IFU4_9ACTN|nr:helix-turn-helix transcriptional regulator [Blastococcus carthaginiensis]MDP5184440.1 helix-turn-helix transcriptional regulator [Blastococcus carthaginiensis]